MQFINELINDVRNFDAAKALQGQDTTQIILILLVTLFYIYLILPIFTVGITKYLNNNLIKLVLVFVVLRFTPTNDLFTTMAIAVILVSTLNQIHKNSMEETVLREVSNQLGNQAKNMCNNNKEGFCAYDEKEALEPVYLPSEMFQNYDPRGKNDKTADCGTVDVPYIFNLNDKNTIHDLNNIHSKLITESNIESSQHTLQVPIPSIHPELMHHEQQATHVISQASIVPQASMVPQVSMVPQRNDVHHTEGAFSTSHKLKHEPGTFN